MHIFNSKSKQIICFYNYIFKIKTIYIQLILYIIVKKAKIFKRQQIATKMQEITLLSVMKYLKDNHYEQSWIALENESNIKLQKYTKQIEFFRKILFKGDFHQTIQFFKTLQPHLQQKDYTHACLTIYKQKLYELIDLPNQKLLKNLFQNQIIQFCDQDQFQRLFTLLACRKTQQITGLNSWTVIKGRIHVFYELLPLVQSLFVDKQQKNSNTSTPQFNLDEAIALYLHQHSNIKIDEASNVYKNTSIHTRKQIKKSGVNQVQSSQIRKSQINNQKLGQSDKRLISLQLSQSQYDKSKFVYDKKSLTNKSSIHQNPSSTKPLQKGIKQSRAQYLYNQINEISQQEQRSDTIKSTLMDKSKVQPQYFQRSLEQSEKSSQNMEYLEQTNSVVYNNQARDVDNFTFDQQRPRKIVKLATIGDSKAIRTCRFSSSGNFFALGTNSSYLKIFYVQDLFAENKPQTHLDPIYQINGLHSKSLFCLDWANNESSMVTCSNDLTIKVTDFNQQFTSHQTSMIGRHESCIRMVKFNEQQTKIFSCGDDSLVKVWDIGKIKRCYNLKGHKSGISAFKLSHCQNQLFSVSKDSTIKKWDLRTLQAVATSKPQEHEMTFIANNTERIVASNRNGNVLFFDDQLNVEYQVKIHQEEIRSIQAAKNNDLFLTASFDGHVAMFSQKVVHSPDYFQHNQNSQDKVVFATFLDHPEYKGFASTSTLGLCHIYSYY